MKFSSLRQPAISAFAVLLISGAGIAFASNGTSSAPAAGAQAVLAAPAVEVAPVVEVVEPAGADTDTLQEGDQTTPDAPGAEAPEAGTEAGTEADGPGGHADDPNDPNADHQFEGNE